MSMDERDVVFARMRYRKGTPVYEDYYERHPELREGDDELRAMPSLGAPETPTFNPMASPIVDGTFELLAGMHGLVEPRAKNRRLDVDPEKGVAWLSGLALQAGACSFGVLKMSDSHYYTHHGRPEERYGKAVKGLPYGILTAVPMHAPLNHRAPHAAEMVGTALGYLDAAKVSLLLAWTLAAAGWKARAHMDGSYQAGLVRTARDAGVGVVGRNGLIITEEKGPCVRLGLVTTDLPLELSSPSPREGHIHAFCKNCLRCARLCQAIPKNADLDERVDGESCFQIWRRLGTDCGVCISSCPLTDDDTRRKVFEAADGASFQAILQDYEVRFGRRPYLKEPPEWLK